MKIYIKVTSDGLLPDCDFTKTYSEAHRMKYLSYNALLYLMNEHNIIISNNKSNNILAEYRAIKGLSKIACASLFGVSGLTITNWEKKGKPPQRIFDIIGKEYPLLINPALAYNNEEEEEDNGI